MSNIVGGISTGQFVNPLAQAFISAPVLESFVVVDCTVSVDLGATVVDNDVTLSAFSNISIIMARMERFHIFKLLNDTSDDADGRNLNKCVNVFCVFRCGIHIVIRRWGRVFSPLHLRHRSSQTSEIGPTLHKLGQKPFLR